MKNAVNKLLEINTIIKSLDPALQKKASEVLINMAFGDVATNAQCTNRSRRVHFNESKEFSFVHEELPIDRPQFHAPFEHLNVLTSFLFLTCRAALTTHLLYKFTN